MGILRKISNWYFSKDALPYWCVLLLDVIIVMMSGYLAAYLQLGGMELAMNFWPLTYGLLITAFIFAVFFKVFHTYSGIVRYSSFIDLHRIIQATLCGSAVTFAVAKILEAISAAQTASIMMPNFSRIVIIFVAATLLLGAVRIAVKMMFEVFRRDENTPKAYIYGIKEGGISIAKGLNSQDTIMYTLRGFVAPPGDLDVKYLMGKKVLKDGPGLIDKLKEDNAAAIFVSPLQAENFRKRDDLVNGLVDSGIKIMMMTEPERWDGSAAISHHELHEIDVEDLLPREQIQLTWTP